MDPDSSSLTQIILLIFLVMLNAFFAMSEMAVVSLNDAKLSKLARDGDKKAKKLLKILEDPNDFLSTIQVGVTLSGFLASAIAADTFADKIVHSFAGYISFVSPETLRVVAIIVITLILSYITLVFGELVPKRVAMHNPERISFAVIGLLSGLTAGLKPIVRLLSGSTNLVLRLMRIDPHSIPEDTTEEEIRMMLDVGNERGNIEESEKHMIHNIFEFDDKYVEDIMTHRTEIIAIEIDATLEKILETATQTGYSRIPVYENDLDSIKGVLYAKDLLEYAINRNGEFNIYEYLRDPLFVIETNTCDNLLAQFQEKKIQIAIVVDEYGGTAGLVTMEDLLEAIVGNIQDEYDDEEEEILQLSENTYIVDGLTPIEDFIEFFALSNVDDEDNFDTIGGYVLSQLGEIPNEGDEPSVTIGNILVTIKEMDERRIAKLTAEVMIEDEEDQQLVDELDNQDKPKGIREK